MFLDGILSISGEQGLFKLVSKGGQKVIVESLITGKRMPAFSTTRISTLEDVAIFTEDEDIPIEEVFISIYDKYKSKLNLSNKSSSKELEDFMSEVLPNYDKERVYKSDIKKVANWYNQLFDSNIINEENINKAKEEAEKDDKEDSSSEEKAEK